MGNVQMEQKIPKTDWTESQSERNVIDTDWHGRIILWSERARNALNILVNKVHK